jgi:hypothetical protein
LDALKTEKQLSVLNMRLSEDDVNLFYKLNPALLLFVNLRLGLQKEIVNMKNFLSLQLEKKVEVRNALYDNIDLIDEFVEKNPDNFSLEELDIISSWKNFLKSTFYIFRYLKKYSVFLASDTDAKAYGVLGISSDLKEMFPHLPIMVDTVLIPFKNHVIYDGFMAPYSMTFGGGIRRNFKTIYDEAKAKYGIIATLPFEPKGKKQTDEGKLKYYLKNERNREYYWDEIQDLIYENKKLMVIYHQEMGKSHARTYGRRLREIGLSDAWFGILEGQVIASGKTKEDLEKNLRALVPSHKRKFVYLYRLKSKTKK